MPPTTMNYYRMGWPLALFKPILVPAYHITYGANRSQSGLSILSSRQLTDERVRCLRHPCGGHPFWVGMGVLQILYYYAQPHRTNYELVYWTPCPRNLKMHLFNTELQPLIINFWLVCVVSRFVEYVVEEHFKTNFIHQSSLLSTSTIPSWYACRWIFTGHSVWNLLRYISIVGSDFLEWASELPYVALATWTASGKPENRGAQSWR